MSRVGYSEIKIAEKVSVSVEKGGEYGHQIVKVDGPKGSLSQSLRPGVNVQVNDDVINLTRDNEHKQTKSNHGLYRSLINNMILGVSEGFFKKLEIVGIGYRAEMQGQNVVFSLGLSHKITLTPPVGINVILEDQTKVRVEGTDKQLVGQIASKIRGFKKPEPYKGKGVRYHNEVVKKKSAKSV